MRCNELASAAAGLIKCLHAFVQHAYVCVCVKSGCSWFKMNQVLKYSLWDAKMMLIGETKNVNTYIHTSVCVSVKFEPLLSSLLC